MITVMLLIVLSACPGGDDETSTAGTTLAVEPIRIEAETYVESKEHVKAETCSEGGEFVGWISDGEWIRFGSVEFGRVKRGEFRARGASATRGGRISVRVDDAGGAIVGSCEVAGTGGWQNWTTTDCTLSKAISGKRTLYLTFTGEDSYLFNINWIEFGA